MAEREPITGVLPFRADSGPSRWGSEHLGLYGQAGDARVDHGDTRGRVHGRSNGRTGSADNGAGAEPDQSGRAAREDRGHNDTGAKKVSKNNTHHRYATKDDIKYIVDTACEVVPNMPHYKGVFMDKPTLSLWIEMCIDKKDTYAVSVLCDSHTDKPVGLGVCYCVPMIFSTQKASHDIFLYIEPEWRSMQNVGKMYFNYKKWAKEQGAIFIAASHTGGYESAAMDVLLRRNGFERIGATYHARV